MSDPYHLTDTATTPQPAPSLSELIIGHLRRLSMVDVFCEPEAIADRMLATIADRMRQEIGPSDCGCGGCDSCVQHALVDWLDPR